MQVQVRLLCAALLQRTQTVGRRCAPVCDGGHSSPTALLELARARIGHPKWRPLAPQVLVAADADLTAGKADATVVLSKLKRDMAARKAAKRRAS